MYCRLLAVRSSSATRTNLVKHAARNGGENATSRSASGKPTHYKPSTMSEMPQPQGSWTHINAKRQSKYNMHLLAGLGFTGFTLFAGYQTGAFYLNLGPDLAKTEINVVTHKQVRDNAVEPEPEDVPPVVVMEIIPEPAAAAEPEAPPATEAAVESAPEASAAPPAEEGEAPAAPASTEQVLTEAVVEAIVEAVAEAAVEVAAEAVVSAAAAAEVVETAAEASAEPVVVDPPTNPPSPVAEATEPVAEGESAAETVADAEAAAAPSAEAKEEA